MVTGKGNQLQNRGTSTLLPSYIYRGPCGSIFPEASYVLSPETLSGS